MFGSGTQGLQSRTLSPPSRDSITAELPARARSYVGREVVLEDDAEDTLSYGG